MNAAAAAIAMDALGHEHRLAIYAILYEAGTDGLSAREIAATLGIPPSSLTFHTQTLMEAGLIKQNREGRSLMYSTEFATMSALVLFLSRKFIGVGATGPRSKRR
jgi:ArsR family transcriptional regulator, arsenate/arsenite/antimonite-responsive transcriptional repressor